jgi:hypothetical protein
MTTIAAPKSVKRFVWHWMTSGFGTVGVAMAVGLIPIELVVSAIAHRIAPEENTVPR